MPPDYKLYHSFNEDSSSFGFITYKESRERKDILNSFFSSKAVIQAYGMIIDKVEALSHEARFCSNRQYRSMRSRTFSTS